MGDERHTTGTSAPPAGLGKGDDLASAALDDELARLGAATSGLAPTSAFVEQVLARLAEGPEQRGGPKEARLDLDGELARLGAATSGLAPDAGLDEALRRRLEHDSLVLQPLVLQPLAPRPSALAPSDAPSAPRKDRSLAEGVTRVGPVAVLVAAVAAAASLLLWLETEKRVGAELWATSSVVEASE